MKKIIFLTVALVISSLAIFAQAKKDSVRNTVVYTCPMHPDVISDKPGKCPKCGMTLVVAAKVYTCPMHPDVVSSKPGKCPKCGMTLVEKKKPAHMNMMKDSTMKM